MEQQHHSQAHASDGATQSPLMQMIIKLRWIGLDDEAKRLESEARRLPAEQRCSVLFDPSNTD
jgi:hypothetical protein